MANGEQCYFAAIFPAASNLCRHEANQGHAPDLPQKPALPCLRLPALAYITPVSGLPMRLGASSQDCACSSRHDTSVADWLAAGIFGFRPTLHCYNYTNALVPATFTRDTVGESALVEPW